jgi:hypothetical protein
MPAQIVGGDRVRVYGTAPCAKHTLTMQPTVVIGVEQHPASYELVGQLQHCAASTHPASSGQPCADHAEAAAGRCSAASPTTRRCLACSSLAHRLAKKKRRQWTTRNSSTTMMGKHATHFRAVLPPTSRGSFDQVGRLAGWGLGTTATPTGTMGPARGSVRAGGRWPGSY